MWLYTKINDFICNEAYVLYAEWVHRNWSIFKQFYHSKRSNCVVKIFDHFQRFTNCFRIVISYFMLVSHISASNFYPFWKLLLDLPCKNIRFNVSLIMIMITMIRISFGMCFLALAKQYRDAGASSTVSAVFLAIWQTKHQIYIRSSSNSSISLRYGYEWNIFLIEFN